MRRHTIAPRANWEQKVAEAGLTWHTGEQIYWNESAYYEFTAKEVDALEQALPAHGHSGDRDPAD
jgi:glutathionylspermidine synthase